MYALSTTKNVIGMNSQTGDYVNDAKAKMYVHTEGRTDWFWPRFSKDNPHKLKVVTLKQIQCQENGIITWNSAQLVSVSSDILYVPGM